ncbi:hypothetical protein F2Q69_00045959 [Brassica cretica]|uniref:Uncharacterized protein n=1 Tax=Brassica cretica TaxID=69181 RepID=A0A8S9PPR3_BRACR|nr:hypothetical protein F2Q69_00045959 [Brassica cretica]
MTWKSKFHLIRNPTKLPNDSEERMRTPAWQVMVYRVTRPEGKGRFGMRSYHTTFGNPILFTLCGIDRVRHEFGPQHDNITVMNILQRGTTGSSFSRSLSC